MYWAQKSVPIINEVFLTKALNYFIPDGRKFDGIHFFLDCLQELMR
jgi:hypothetical protein